MSDGSPDDRDPRFRPVRPLGAGGTGDVYLAHDNVLHRLVAVKRIATATPAERAAVAREARLTASIKHANVLMVHDVQVADDHVDIIYEYIEGTELSRMTVPLPWAEVLALAVDLASGLAALHGHEPIVLHRDIKPANAILEHSSKRAKLIDLGVAKQVDQDPGQSSITATARPGRHAGRPGDDVQDLACLATPTGARPGTPRYLAPEIWDGAPATTRSDVYSFGAMLYELCTGRAAPVLRDPDARRALRLDRDDIDGRFVAIIHRCVALQPEKRYASGRELAADLEAVAATLDQIENPYRGLFSFQQEHHALFFGRDGDIRNVIEHWSRARFVLLCGDSGAGKTSLALAGVLPRVVERGLGGADPWVIACAVPGKRPVEAIANALGRVCGAASEAIVAWAQKDDPGPLFPEPGPPGSSSGEKVVRVALFVDQLEELVTVSEPTEARRATRLLASLIGHDEDRVRVLGATRGDRLTDLAELPGFGPLLQQQHGNTIYVVTTPQPEGIRAAIVKPAHRSAVRFESEAMVDRLVTATLEARGGLPLLQFALAELWDARDRAERVIEARSLDAIGGVGGALARHADAALRELADGAHRTAARRMLIKLVTLHETRALCTESELVGDDPVDRAVLAHLVERRLLVCHESDTEDSRAWVYSIAHEALVSAWPRLRDWLDGEREQRAVLARLAGASQEWERLRRPHDALWSEQQLGEAAILLPGSLSAREADFVRASRAVHRQARRRRRALVLAVVTVIGAVYSGVRYQSSRAVAAQIDGQVSGARRMLSPASKDAERFFALLAQARAALQHDRMDGWPEPWQQALVLEPGVTEAYRQASLALEAALALDPERRDVRAFLADVLDTRIRLADTLGRGTEMRELVDRLTLVDPRSSARWRDPIRVAITTEPDGGEVTIERYEATGAGTFEARPVARALATPQTIDLAPGSYLVTVHATAERVEVRYPVLVRSRAVGGHSLAVTITRPLRADMPDGFVYVPAGCYLHGLGQGPEDDALRDWYETVPLHERCLSGYLVARYETTMAEWLEWVADCPDDACWADRARGRAIEIREDSRYLEVSRATGSRWQIEWQPDAPQDGYDAGADAPLVYAARDRQREHDWLRFPVSGVSAEKVKQYLVWLRETKRLRGADLCTELQWERAARGADDRMFPHGNHLDPDDANIDLTYGRVSGAFGPDEVGMHPHSASPFGVEDLAGNVAEMTWTAFSSEKSITARGGSFFFPASDARVYGRWAVTPEQTSPILGFRVCAPAPASETFARVSK